MRKPEQRKHGVVKLVVAAPEQDGIALFSRVERRLYPRLKMRGDADFDIPRAALRKAPLVVVGEALDALQSGRACLVFTLVSDEKGDHQITAVDSGIQHQIPALSRLRNQPADDLHGSPIVITESKFGLGIPGEVRHLADAADMTAAILHSARVA